MTSSSSHGERKASCVHEAIAVPMRAASATAREPCVRSASRSRELVFRCGRRGERIPLARCFYRWLGGRRPANGLESASASGADPPSVWGDPASVEPLMRAPYYIKRRAGATGLAEQRDASEGRARTTHHALRWSAVVSLTLALGVRVRRPVGVLRRLRGPSGDDSGGSGSGRGGTSGNGRQRAATGFGGNFTGGTGFGGNFRRAAIRIRRHRPDRRHVPDRRRFPDRRCADRWFRRHGSDGRRVSDRRRPDRRRERRRRRHHRRRDGRQRRHVHRGWRPGGTITRRDGRQRRHVHRRDGRQRRQPVGSAARPSNCLECISQSCPEATACFQNPACVEGLICGASACGGLEGPVALRCWVACFNGDTGLALQALTAAVCLSARCSVACQGFGQ